jgi:hypothetical protein
MGLLLAMTRVIQNVYQCIGKDFTITGIKNKKKHVSAFVVFVLHDVSKPCSAPWSLVHPTTGFTTASNNTCETCVTPFDDNTFCRKQTSQDTRFKISWTYILTKNFTAESFRLIYFHSLYNSLEDVNSGSLAYETETLTTSRYFNNQSRYTEWVIFLFVSGRSRVKISVRKPGTLKDFPFPPVSLTKCTSSSST